MNEPAAAAAAALPRRSGGQVLVDQLRIHGVDTAFCVPGESYLAVLDALHDSVGIRTISCRQEGGAAFMAEAYGKLTGRPGVLLVTRGPGACNASIGVHTAFQDSTPMVVLIGQVAREQEYREAFQEVNYRSFYAEITKWTAQVQSADRLPELLSQAFHRACSGRPGPVALALPEDMLTELTDVADAGPYQVVRPGADVRDVLALGELLETAKRPLVILGGGGWSGAAVDGITAFAESNNLPVACAFRCQDRFDNEHACYVGDVGIGIAPALARRVANADLIVAIGPRLGEMTTQGYTLLEVPRPRQRLVHVHADASELGRVYQPDLAICAGMESFARALGALEPVDSRAWGAWLAEARGDYLDNLEPNSGLPDRLDMHAVMMTLARDMPDAIITTDAGNFSGWSQRFWSYRRFPSQLGPTCGAMGYGVPDAIAARHVHRDRPVVGFCGDGGALMTGQEIATAVHQGIDPVILVVNNNMYGTIRMHQEREYPGRVHATSLSNPDFAHWAQSFGAFGEVVERTEDFAPALRRAREAGRIAVLELRIEPELISTRTTLDAIRNRKR